MNIFKTALTNLSVMGALLFSPMMVADVSGSVGLSSDYFWRGVSQNNMSPAIDLSLEVSEGRWFGGVWASQVDFGDEASVEYDLYGGINVISHNDFVVDLGYIQYRWDGGYDDVEEVFITASYKGLDMSYHRDRHDARSNYLEVGVDVPWVDMVDMSVHYGLLNNGDDIYSIKMSKNLSDRLILSAMLFQGPDENLDDVSIGRDNLMVALHYNF
tara:strand:- start:1408 stop:2049 length:642 start_codon:yes stop_codon:yes gene_type:complete